MGVLDIVSCTVWAFGVFCVEQYGRFGYCVSISPGVLGIVSRSVRAFWVLCLEQAMRNYDRQAIKATWQPFIYWLEKALNSLEPVPSRTALYRGIGIPFIMRTFYTGKVVTWPSFTSTSVNHDVATSFLSSGSGLVFVLRTRQGRAVGHLSEFPWEEEVLLPGNSQFRVERLMEPIFGDAGEIIEKEITSEMAAQKSQVIIYMTEVGQK